MRRLELPHREAPDPKSGVSTNFTTSALIFNKKDLVSNLNQKVVLPVRFERTAYALEGRCSIQLSYGSNNNKNGVSNGARTHDPRNHNPML